MLTMQTSIRCWVRVLLFAVSVTAILTGCTQTLDRARDSVEAEKAMVAGYQDIRMYLDSRIDEMKPDSRDWVPVIKGRNLEALMISGGGSGGRIFGRRPLGLVRRKDTTSVRHCHRGQHRCIDRALCLPGLGLRRHTRAFLHKRRRRKPRR